MVRQWLESVRPFLAHEPKRSQNIKVENTMTKVAFIGAGNMNGSILKGLVANGFSANDIIVSNPSPGKREQLAKNQGVKHTKSNVEAATFADFIVLGVKPHFIAEVCEEISANTDISEKCFISVAAGSTIAQIQKALGGQYSVIRTMPNTPAQLGLGMTGLFASPETTDLQKHVANDLLSAAGETVWLERETQIDEITSLSGSGPAYFFLFMEAMQAQARAYGFDKETSRKIVQQTALGAANMVIENSSLDISTLRENVTSKGGTTQAALNTFIEGELPQLVTNAISSALQRAQEIAQNSK